MPSSASRAIDAAADGLGWSRNTRNPARVRSCSSPAVSAVSSGAARLATATTRLPAANSPSSTPARVVGDVGAAVEDRLGSAFRDEEPLPSRSASTDDAAAIVIEGDDGDPAEARRWGWSRAPGASQRATSRGLPPTAVSPVGVASLHTSPSVSTSRAVVAGGVDRSFEADVAVGERAGLVGEQHVDVAEVLDAHQPLDEHLLLRRAAGTRWPGWCDTTAGQQLGGDARPRPRGRTARRR